MEKQPCTLLSTLFLAACRAVGQINHTPGAWDPEWVTATLVVYRDEGPQPGPASLFSVIFEDEGESFRVRLPPPLPCLATAWLLAPQQPSNCIHHAPHRPDPTINSHPILLYPWPQHLMDFRPFQLQPPGSALREGPGSEPWAQAWQGATLGTAGCGGAGEPGIA